MYTNYSLGLRGGVFENTHEVLMGQFIWLNNLESILPHYIKLIWRSLGSNFSIPGIEEILPLDMQKMYKKAVLFVVALKT